MTDRQFGWLMVMIVFSFAAGFVFGQLAANAGNWLPNLP